MSQDFTLQQVLVPDLTGDTASTPYHRQDVQVVDGSIVAIAPQLPVVGTAINAEGQLLLPGLVNAHSHSPEMWSRGLIPPLPLELWLCALYDCPPLTPEETYLAALWTAAETLLSGATTLVDHLILTPNQEIETIEAAVRAYREIGIRAVVAPLTQDQPLEQGLAGASAEPLPVTEQTKVSLALLEDAIDRFHRPQDGIYIAVGPTGAHLCSDGFLEGCSALAAEHDLCCHTHLLETRVQRQLALERYGVSAITHLNKIGFLGPKTSLAHGVWPEPEDLSVLAATGAMVVHNPLSNLRLGSGIAPVLKYRQAGVNVTFGCDGAASNDAQDLLEAMKIGLMLHNTSDLDYRHWITPAQAVTMASAVPMAGLGLSQRGQLRVGSKADFALYDLDHPTLLPTTDPLGMLMLGRPVGAVHSLWVDGQAVIENHQLTRIDRNALHQQLRQRRQHLQVDPPRIAPEIIRRYRQTIGLT